MYSFDMSYPCFILHRPDGGVEWVTSGGDGCLCLFTSRPAAEAFLRTQRGGGRAESTVLPTKAAAYEALSTWQKELAAQGITHLAIDFAPGGRVGRVPIGEFLDSIRPAA